MRSAFIAAAVVGVALLFWFAPHVSGPRVVDPPTPPATQDVIAPSSDPSPPRTAHRDDGPRGLSGQSSLEGTVRSGGVPTAAAIELRYFGRSARPVPGSDYDGRDAEAEFTRAFVTASVTSSVQATAGDGAFRAGGLAEGRYRLTAILADGRRADRAVDVAGSSTSVAVDVPAGTLELSGRVIGGDGTPAETWIGLLPDMGSLDDALAWVAAGAEGRFRFVGLASCRVRVAALVPGRSVMTSGPIDLPCRDFSLCIGGDRRVRSGRVRSAKDGSAIAGATVTVRAGAEHDSSQAYITRTGPGGFFRTPLPRGARIHVTAPGFGPAERDDDGRTDEMEFSLSRCGSIRGRVVSRDGNAPVAGVLVHASYLAYEQPERDETHTVSGPDGSFRLDGVGPEDVWVYARGEGWSSVGLADLYPMGASALRVRVPPASEATFDVTVEPVSDARVRVVDERGAPVAGARVSAPGHPYYRSIDVEAQTGPDGYAQLRGLVPRVPYCFRAEVAGRAAAESDSIQFVGSGETAEVTIRLRPARTVPVKVVEYESGRPLAGAMVWQGWRSGPRSPHDPPPRLTGADGTALVGPLVLAPNRVCASAPARVTAQVELRDPSRGAGAHPFFEFDDDGEEVPHEPLTDDGTETVTIRMRRGGIVAGRVTFPAGVKPRPVQVTVEAEYPEPATPGLPHVWPDYGASTAFVATRGTDSEGRFRFDTVPEGACTVRALTGDNERPFSADKIQARTGVEDLVVPVVGDRHFAVRVVDPDGMDVASAWVYVHWESSGSGGPAHRGIAWFARPSPGTPGRVSVAQPVRAGAGGPLGARTVDLPADLGTEFVVELRPERVLTGRVVGPDGSGVPDVSVGLSLGWHGDYATTDGEGRFRFERLGDETSQIGVRARAGWLSIDALPAVAGPEETVVRLRRCDPVGVRVCDDDGRPVPGCVVDAGAEEGPRPRSRGTTGADGMAVLTELDSSRTYTLDVKPPGEGRSFFPRNLRDWKPADTTVVVDRMYAVRGVVRAASWVPMPFVDVTLRGERRDAIPSASDGTFEVGGLRRGERVELAIAERLIRAPADGARDDAEPELQWIQATAGDPEVVLVLPTGPLLVVDTAGEGYSSVDVLEDGRLVRSTAYGLGHSSGVWYFADLDPSRTYTVWAAPRRGGGFGLLAAVQPDDRVHVVERGSGAGLSGRVAVRGEFRAEEIPGICAERDGMRAWCRARSDGTFSFPSLPEGKWRLSVEEGQAGAWQGTAEAHTGEQVVLTLRRE